MNTGFLFIFVEKFKYRKSIFAEKFVLKQLLQYCIILATLLTFFSCKDRDEYRVNSDFEPYVIRFEQEAKLRGDTLNLRKRGLIVEFGNLKDNVAGLCHYGNPIRIEIDREYWERMGKYAGAEQVREELIFHEMGHGILGRKHLNSTLSNGEWKSIMCGGDKIDERSWNVNYRGMRRAYYLDELFRESTSESPIFSEAPQFNSSDFIQVLGDNFDDASATLWKLGSTPDAYVSIENSMLRYQSKTVENMAVISNIPNFNIQSDFILEYTFQYKDTANNAKYGPVIGTIPTTTSDTESVDFFVINNNKILHIGNTRWYSYFTQVRRNEILPKERNNLRILKISNMMYFFINNKFAYASEIENKQFGSAVGFMIPGMQTVYLDDFKLYKRAENAGAAKVISVLPEKLEFRSYKSSIHELKQKK